MFSDLVCKWGYAHIFDGYLVEGLKAVHDLKRFAVFFHDAEPLEPVEWVRGFIYSCIYFDFNKLANFFIYSRWNRNISLGPWLVWNCWDFWSVGRNFPGNVLFPHHTRQNPCSGCSLGGALLCVFWATGSHLGVCNQWLLFFLLYNGQLGYMQAVRAVIRGCFWRGHL